MPDHLEIDSIIRSNVALITGNPDRVSTIISFLKNPKLLNSKRGLLCYEGDLNNPILVAATGMGAPATAIVVEELIELGIKAIVRVGSCGSIQDTVLAGDIVVPIACVRDEGTSKQYIESIFPAVADFTMHNMLIEKLQSFPIKFHTGIVHCKDAYYSERLEKQIDPSTIERRWNMWRQSGVLATEMESSAIFVLGSIRSIKTASILVAVDDVEDPSILVNAMMTAIETSLECLDIVSNLIK